MNVKPAVIELDVGPASKCPLRSNSEKLTVSIRDVRFPRKQIFDQPLRFRELGLEVKLPRVEPSLPKYSSPCFSAFLLPFGVANKPDF
jgi:hypothetical protein